MTEESRRGRHVIGAAIALGVIALFGLWLAPERADSSESATLAEVASLAARVAVLERQNADLMSELRRNPKDSNASQRAQAGSPEPGGRVEQVERVPSAAEHARMEQQRLVALESKFENEPVSPEWASIATIELEDSIAVAMERAGIQGLAGNVDCRSKQCRTRIILPDDVYNDFLLHLSAATSRSLPKARIVTIPRGDGSHDVSIFSSAGSKG